jgi:menaquinone-specific isochorismate synthase
MLATSTKDIDEHAFAVRSVVDALTPLTTTLRTSEAFTLKLPNVWHIATDVSGSLADGTSSLDLVGALHPTAAVAGTPTRTALGIIGELEPFDRGRYAGAVGWVGANGDGEWGVALRCMQVESLADGTRDVTAHAGAGIVVDSRADSELIETTMKFRPIVDALSSPRD